MKEKIQLIILVALFIVLLIFINTMLDKNDIKDNSLGKVEDNVSVENVANTEVISSNYGNEIESEVANNTVINNVENDVGTKNQEIGEVMIVTEETFDKEVLNSDKKVLIDFYADWCGPCKVLSPIVEEVAKENTDLKVVKINVDENEHLAYKYRAYSIPTLVVIENGEEVNRAVGAIPKASILDLVK